MRAVKGQRQGFPHLLDRVEETVRRLGEVPRYPLLHRDKPDLTIGASTDALPSTAVLGSSDSKSDLRHGQGDSMGGCLP